MKEESIQGKILLFASEVTKSYKGNLLNQSKKSGLSVVQMQHPETVNSRSCDERK